MFALGSFAIFAREYKSFYDGAGLRARDYVLSDGAFAVRPLGLASVTREIERCFDAQADLAAAVLLPAARARGYRACLALTDAVLLGTPLLRGAPAQGAALQLRAEMLAALARLAPDLPPGEGDDSGHAGADMDGAIAAQLLAAAAAPRTAWLMQRRLLVVLSMPNPEDPRLAGMVARDLPHLMQLPQTRRWLAEVYLARPALRPMLARLEGVIGETEAAAFLQSLRAQVKAGEAAAADGRGTP